MGMFRRFFFNLWYFRRPPWDTGISPPELMEFIHTHSPGWALDLGCGTGTNVITLARNGWQATGIDFAPRAIRIAKSKARQEQVQAKFMVDDATRLEGLSGPFDLILDMGCFHSLDAAGRRDYLHNITRLLATGGAFLLYVFFRQPGESGPGLEPADLEAVSRQLDLVWREDGTNRGMRPSAWLQFERKTVQGKAAP